MSVDIDREKLMAAIQPYDIDESMLDVVAMPVMARGDTSDVMTQDKVLFTSNGYVMAIVWASTVTYSEPHFKVLGGGSYGDAGLPYGEYQWTAYCPTDPTANNTIYLGLSEKRPGLGTDAHIFVCNNANGGWKFTTRDAPNAGNKTSTAIAGVDFTSAVVLKVNYQAAFVKLYCDGAEKANHNANIPPANSQGIIFLEVGYPTDADAIDLKAYAKGWEKIS